MCTCDHTRFAEALTVYVEGKCLGCGKIKFKKKLEEAFVGQDKILDKESK